MENTLAVILNHLGESEVDTLKRVVTEGSSPETKRAYQSDLRYLEIWCMAATGLELEWPASETLIFTFIAHHIGVRDPNSNLVCSMPSKIQANIRAKARHYKTGKPLKLATIRRKLASWGSAHVAAGFKNPVTAEPVKMIISKARRFADKTQPHSANPITREVLNKLLNVCGSGTKGLRDRAMLLVAFGSGGRRRSEICSLQVENIKQLQPVLVENDRRNCLELHFENTKTVDVKCMIAGDAADVLLAWLSHADIIEGPVFRSVDRHGYLGHTAITPDGFYSIIKSLVQKAGLDPALFSPHGLRSGFLTQAGMDGYSLGLAMQQSGHQSMQQANAYFQPGEKMISGIAMIANSGKHK